VLYNAIREKAKNASKKATDHMVLRSKREFPPSEYEVNEEVIIKIQHGVLRARAVEHIVSNVDMFLEFIEDKNIEKNKFVASLSTDRE